MNLDLVTIREATADDDGFVYNSWLKSSREDAKDMPSHQFYRAQHALIDQMLKTSKVFMAVFKDDPSFIYGYVVVQVVDNIPVLHFCYTKHSFRRFGILKLLLSKFWKVKEDSIIVTYQASYRKKLFDRYKFIYEPKLKRLGAIA